MAKLKFFCSLLILAVLISLPLASTALANQPTLRQVPTSLSKLEIAIPPDPGVPTLESETKKITPLSTPSVTINPQTTPSQKSVSKPFWASWSRCSIPGGLSCASTAIGAVIIFALVLTGLWLKKSRYKSPT